MTSLIPKFQVEKHESKLVSAPDRTHLPGETPLCTFYNLRNFFALFTTINCNIFYDFCLQKRLDNVQGQFLRVSRWIHNQIGPADWWSRFWRSSFPDEIQDDYEIKLWKPYLNSRIRQDSILCFHFQTKVQGFESMEKNLTKLFKDCYAINYDKWGNWVCVGR